jgi:hypothetical protein
VSTLKDAEDELAKAKLPLPAFLEEDVSPPTALYWLWEAAKTGVVIIRAFAENLQLDTSEEQPVLTEAMNGCLAALVGYTHTLVALEVLPPEAEEALARGQA